MHFWSDLVEVKKETGYIRMICTKKCVKTILQEAYFEGALKITKPVYLTDSGEVYLYLMNPGGGYIDGDSYRIEIVLEEEAEAVVTSQSSTKIYKTPKQPVLQDMKINLKKGSRLHYLPDPVIAYENARFRQETVINMESGASLIFTDIYTPGWAPDGTLFRYDLLQSRLKVFKDGQLILLDYVKLEPNDNVNGIGMMEEYTHFGTMMVIDEEVEQPLVAGLYENLRTFTGPRIGLSMLSVSGFTLRILGNSTQQIEEVMQCCHDYLKAKVFKKPVSFLRKY